MNDNSTFNRRNFLTGGLALGGTAMAGCMVRLPGSAGDIRDWDIVTDVLIAGAGGAGLAAAITAKGLDAEVLIVEHQPIPGGSTAMSGGVSYLGGGTPLQKYLGFEDSVEAMYEYIVAAGPPQPHTDKVQLYCERSADHFRWLVKLGVPFTNRFTEAKGLPFGDESLYYSGNENISPWRELATPAPRGHKPGVADHGGWKLMEVLLAKSKQLGVELMLRSSGERLLLESDGRVAGMLVSQAEADGKQRKTLAIRAKRGVILCCGGFVQNRQMVSLYAPELASISTPWGSAGDLGIGIQMGLGAGGTAIRMNQALITVPLYPPENVLRGIVVNRQAQRFIGEDNYHCFLGDAVAMHQGGAAWLITDANNDYLQPDHRVSVLGSADTLEGLEKLAGFPIGALRHTISYYNYHAQRGDDPLFGKSKALLAPLSKAPFRIYDLNVESNFTPHLTFGGLHTDTDSRVLNIGGEPIEGLYAAGRTTSGLPGSPYVASGISVGDALFFGRRAGSHAGRAES